MDERDIARFWPKVDRRGPSECWPWIGGLQKQGYGNFHVSCPEKRPWPWATWLAHRVSWTIANGPIPGELNVLHNCDYRPCVNPRCLFLGTDLDNMLDMVAKDRSRPCGNRRRGEAHAATRFSDETMRAVREMRLSGVPVKEVAAKFGISTVTVWNYTKGRRSHCLNPKWPNQRLPPLPPP